MFALWLSALLHLYIGWRIAPDLPGPLSAGAFVALLVASAILIPLAFFGRRSRNRDTADRASWAGMLALGLFSTLLVLTLLRDVRAAAGVAVRHRGARRLERRRGAAARAGRAWRSASSTRAAPRVCARSRCRWPGCRARCTASRSRRSATSTSARRSRAPYVQAHRRCGERARRRCGGGDRRPGRRPRARPRAARGAAGRAALAPRHLLRHRQPRVLQRRRRVDRRAEAPGRAGAAQRARGAAPRRRAAGDGRRGRHQRTPLRPAAPQRPAARDARRARRRRAARAAGAPAAQRRGRRAGRLRHPAVGPHARRPVLAVEPVRAAAAALHRRACTA